MIINLRVSMAMGTFLQVVLMLCFPTYTLRLDGDDEADDEGKYSWPKAGMYKFVALVSSKVGICIGTLVNEHWVLTAAHCLIFRGHKIGDREARLSAGVIDYEMSDGRIEQDTMSERIHIHPKFSHNEPSKYDVALVRARDAFEFGQYVGKIEISGEGWPHQYNSLNCLSLGYGGYYSTRPVGNRLKSWNVTAVHSREEDACPCTKRFMRKRLICVKEKRHPLMCLRDDGGPLVCGNTVRGLAHIVWDRLDCDDPVYPTEKCMDGPKRAISAYMFLCPLNDWLHSIVPDIPKTPQSCTSCRRVLSQPILFIVVFLFVIS